MNFCIENIKTRFFRRLCLILFMTFVFIFIVLLIIALTFYKIGYAVINFIFGENEFDSFFELWETCKEVWNK